MDNDIRDLLADDMFDPFEDEEDEDRGTAAEFGAEQTIGRSPDEFDQVVGAPLQPKEEKADIPQLPAEERIAQLLDRMPGQKRLLLRLIAFCQEQKSGVEMDEYTETLKQDCYSVYSPVVMRELLEQAGAIEYVPAEGEGGAGTEEHAEGAGNAGEDAAATETAFIASANVAGDAANDAASLASAPAAAEENESIAAFAAVPLVEGGVLVSVDESKVQHETLMEDGRELMLDYLEIEEKKPGFWVATPAGQAAVAQLDDVGATRRLLEKEPIYLDIYHQILDFCAQEEYGRSSKEIDNLVNNSPLLQEPRRYSGYFVSRLERQGALEWHSGWCITEAGRLVLQECAEKSQKEESHVERD